MTLAMEVNEALYPTDIRLFGSNTEMPHSDCFADGVQKRGGTANAAHEQFPECGKRIPLRASYLPCNRNMRTKAAMRVGRKPVFSVNGGADVL